MNVSYVITTWSDADEGLSQKDFTNEQDLVRFIENEEWIVGEYEIRSCGILLEDCSDAIRKCVDRAKKCHDENDESLVFERLVPNTLGTRLEEMQKMGLEGAFFKRTSDLNA